MIELNALELVPETSEILKQTQRDFDFENLPYDPKDLAFKMNECMKKNDGLGLSACQVGIPYRVFVMRINGDEPLALFNPRIVNQSDNMVPMKEGCLSFSLLYMNVRRPDSVRIRFQTYTGDTKTQQFIGMSARVALHEMDHMQGITYLTRATPFEMQRAMRKRMILKRKIK
jgi:peptide deformylase